MHFKYYETAQQLRTWCQQDKTVHAAILLGSQVREEFEGDEWSDLDLLLLVDDPHIFLQTDTWLAFCGEIVCTTVQETNLDWIHLSWLVKRVLLADNRAIDFSILPYDRIDDVLSVNAEIHANGYQVIYDARTNIVAPKIEATLATVKGKPPQIPTEKELQRTIQALLFELMFACKKIKRNELWVAVSCINQQVSEQLLHLIEFHAASVSRIAPRIDYDGRFLEQRLSPDLAEKLAGCFAKYDAGDAIQTAGHLLDITYHLAQEICVKNDYPFKQVPFERIRTLYVDMFDNAITAQGGVK